MAVENDSRVPGEPEDTLRRVGSLMLAILPVLLVVAGIWNLSVASELGGRDGYSLPALFGQWRDGLDLTRRYSQSYLMAMERLSNSVFQISAALVTACGAAVLAYGNRGKKE
jgi:hypothetical protein